MSDTLSSLLGSAGTNPKIKKKGSKYVVEGIGEFDSYEAAEKAFQRIGADAPESEEEDEDEQ